jgi:hypothetical protein
LVGHHSFMATGCVDDMTWAAWSPESFRCISLLSLVWGRGNVALCPAKGLCTLCTPVHAGSFTFIAWSLFWTVFCSYDFMRTNTMCDMTCDKTDVPSVDWCLGCPGGHLASPFRLRPLLVSHVHARCQRFWHDLRENPGAKTGPAGDEVASRGSGHDTAWNGERAGPGERSVWDFAPANFAALPQVRGVPG